MDVLLPSHYLFLFIYFSDPIVSQKRLKQTEKQTKYRNNTRADQTSSNVKILIYRNWAIALCALTAVISNGYGQIRDIRS